MHYKRQTTINRENVVLPLFFNTICQFYSSVFYSVDKHSKTTFIGLYLFIEKRVKNDYLLQFLRKNYSKYKYYIIVQQSPPHFY